MDKTKHKIEIDFPKLLEIIKKDKKTFCLYIIISAVVSIIVAFSIPRIYKADVVLAPETSTGGLLSSVSSLASMVGLYNEANPTGDAIYPEIYPDLMASTDFLTSLFNIKVKSKDGIIDTTYFEYKAKYQKVAWWLYPLVWLNDFIKMIKGEKGNDNNVNPFQLTKPQYDVMKSIEKSISCEVDKKTNVISISMTEQDPLIVATMADSVKEKLQIFITNYRTNKARNDYKFMENIHKEAETQYIEARKKYAAYSDSNMNVGLQSVQSILDDLENDMQLKYNIYTQVTEQLQMARAKVQERTPAFTVIQPSTVPVKHSNTPKVFILAGFVFIGALIRISILGYKNRQTILRFN